MFTQRMMMHDYMTSWNIQTAQSLVMSIGHSNIIYRFPLMYANVEIQVVQCNGHHRTSMRTKKDLEMILKLISLRSASITLYYMA